MRIGWLLIAAWCGLPGLAFCEDGCASRSAPDCLSFPVLVKFSPKALRTLLAKREDVVLLVTYQGQPTKRAEMHANDVGLINLSNSVVYGEVTSEVRRFHISGSRIDVARLAWIEGPVRVNVNVASARRSGPDNLLDCDFMDVAVSEIKAAGGITLNCSLIGEQHTTKMRP